ncbi:glutathione S-transferase family protein [Pseudogemmobacter faecipullorum]|uniref:Glutathione S-transferase family protein n=1 Tax=Pseudogemmobacter faecipullorum TaxID=2755041 RepID=A0ABS8CLY8_9RHOB|nr:glutathione S-transferase family protein [Pseudogemmobacter faecipullorum]MCB5410407.1 glutathione S-transferase family protein [Pseudogemmobacter faecipullorum]
MTIRLFFSPASPFVRKVMVAAAERGVAVEKLASAAWPIRRDPNIVQHNSTGKVPCLLTQNDEPVFDSRVITQYVDAQGQSGATLYPQDARRFQVLTLEALADSVLEASLLHRYENVLRPEDKRWDEWSRGQMEKVDSGLDDLEGRWFDLLSQQFHAGAIATACLLGYLDFRFPEKDWRSAHPRLSAWFAEVSARPSMQDSFPA